MAKAQVLMFDLMVSVGIFLTAVVLFIFLSDNMTSEGNDFDSLVQNAEAISSSLLSQGEPSDWSYANVSVIGFTDESYKLNLTKVSRLFNMSRENSSRLFGANSNFAIFFKNSTHVLNFGNCTYGNTNLFIQNVSPKICGNFSINASEHLVSIERLLWNPDPNHPEIIKIVVQTWS
jgi:hypothetical protein